MLTLNDGRNELWQWDTGRKLAVDADCSQIHFSNKIFGRSIDVDVVDGVAIIPDVLLQTDKDLTAWAFVGTAENGYTKISKIFKVNKRNKPADYVFTPTEQTTLAGLVARLDKIEESQDPDAIKNAVEDYLEQNLEIPVESVNGKTGKIELTAKDVGAISLDDLQESTNDALAQAKASGEFKGDPGADGQPGKDGVDGKDGYTPQKGIDYFDGEDGQDGDPGEDGVGIASIKQTTTSTADSGNNVFTVTLTNGTSATFTVKNGSKGSTGGTGKDGTSATHSWNGTTLTVTSASGTSSANLKGDKGDKGDSIKGDPGSPGADGVSPTVAVSKSGKVTTISITDKNGTKTATVNDGADGASGSNGKDGTSVTVKSVSESTADGGSNVVTFSDGKTLTIKNGSKGSAGTNGKDGHDPVRGIDYWTDADQEAIVQQVITALGTPVFGRVENNKDIILSVEHLAPGTYTLWAENENGKMTELCTYDTSPGYINWIKRSVEADGTPYNGGQGWKTNTRLSSSGAESTSSATGMEVTGFIPFKRGDVIRFSGITMNGNSANATRCYFIQYKDNDSGEKEMLTQWVVSGFNANINLGQVLTDADGNILQINTGDIADETVSGSVAQFYTTAQYFRISADEINDDSIITINQEID